ncbi:uroporphyrinogen-III synthase [Timonella senegalensis]|uniref:uroporphyrinogen-III synthase n=1 Tax=Timonella senegalensis TaxID=1465825 RepID=UPI002FDC907D
MRDARGSLDGTTTLILRPTERAAGLTRLVEAAGGLVITCPLVRRELISDDSRELVDKATRDLGQFGWVAVTSVNAVDELTASLERTHPGTPLSVVAAQTRWATVGPATTRALEAKGIVVNFEAAENSAAGMLAAWPEQGRERGRVLLPLGDLATSQLEDGLAAMGYATTRVTVYRTVSTPATSEALEAYRYGEIDAVIASSGSVVREFVKQFDPLAAAQLGGEPPALVAIGSPTARTANAMGLSVTTIATTATDHGLFDALERAINLSKEY